MSKKQKGSENYLERIPLRAENLDWSTDENGNVTIHLENKGAFNRLAQKLLKKPEFTHIHLDETGSFVWPLLGEKNILALGETVRERFGEAAEPLYERLAEYFRILDSYHFIIWKEKE